MTSARNTMRSSTLLRSLVLVVVVGARAAGPVSDPFSAYRDLQLADRRLLLLRARRPHRAGRLERADLARARRADGGRGVHGGQAGGNDGWALVPELAAAAVVTLIIGIPVGLAASRLRGPYLAGATLAFAVGLPALADKFPTAFGGENGLTINPPTPPASLGVNFPLERWQAWIACIGALIVVFVFYNLAHSGVGRALRAVARRRDRRFAGRPAGRALADARVHAERGGRRPRRRPARGRDAARWRPARSRSSSRSRCWPAW